ncbi:hypothetical protein KBD11_02490 [Candidatus Saccharibacteria bacterium]|nr:hypothetical protein [Candidatus Saccharibacteria bacterium]
MEVFVPPSSQDRPVAFTDQFRSFYDPRQDFSRDQSQELRQWLCDGRSASPDPDVRLWEGSRVLADELANTRRIYIDRHDNAGGLYIPHSELDDIVDAADFGAQQTIVGLKYAVDKLFHDHPYIAERAKTEDPELIITYGGIGSAVSHHGQKRRDGKDYAVHPWESVIIAEAVESKAFGQRIPEEYRLQSALLKYATYAHDELEDDMSSAEGERNWPFLASPKLHLPPLVHYELLKNRGVSEEIADYISDGLLSLTKTVGLGGREDWRKYIRVLASAAPVAPRQYEGTITEVKDVEMHYNSVVDRDKRPSRRKLKSDAFRSAQEKYWRRKRDYDWARNELHRYRQDLVGYPAEIASHVPTITARDIAHQKATGSFASLLEPRMLVEAYFAAKTQANT